MEDSTDDVDYGDFDVLSLEDTELIEKYDSLKDIPLVQLVTKDITLREIVRLSFLLYS